LSSLCYLATEPLERRYLREEERTGTNAVEECEGTLQVGKYKLSKSVIYTFLYFIGRNIDLFQKQMGVCKISYDRIIALRIVKDI
jgi:hypothetical protein